MSTAPEVNWDETIPPNLAAISSRVKDCAAKNGDSLVTLVAVSKTKPLEAILAAHRVGHIRFGENYIQELVSKCEEIQAKEIAFDGKFSFIGALQSNKVNALIKSGYSSGLLDCVETVTSIKLARKLNDSVGAVRSDNASLDKLKVYVQVNTSGEESKGGCSPSEESPEVVDLVRFIHNDCSENLSLVGLMTIGAVDDSKGAFEVLKSTKQRCEMEVEGCGSLKLRLVSKIVM